MGIAGLAARVRSRFGWDGAAPPGARPALLLISGLPGTGKSHLAEAIAARHPARIVRTDEVRKALFRQPTYSGDESGTVYRVCHALIERLLRDGHAVVFDATNLHREGRQRARAIGAGAGVPVLTLSTTAPPEVVAARLARRVAGEGRTFSSDAGWDVYTKLAPSAEPVQDEEEHIVVDTSRSLAPAMQAVDNVLGVAPGAGSDAPGPTFAERLAGAMTARDSLLCVGLDPEVEKLPAALRGLPPAEAVLAFNREIIAATADQVVAYKPNLAFYEALGPAGLQALRETLRLVPPGVLTIGDGKRGDIPNTMRLYARALFEVYGFDAVTASPYLGWDALEPLVGTSGRGVFVLCRTSNPGAAEVTDLEVAGEPLYLRVAERVRAWNEKGNLGLVVGATVPRQLGAVRAACPELPILLPGVGAQGGDLQAALAAGVDGAGRGLLVTAARQVLYASSGADFQTAARRVATSLRAEINRVRREAPSRRPEVATAPRT